LGNTAWVTGYDGTGYALDFSAVTNAGNSVSIGGGFLDTVSNEISIAFWTYSTATTAVQTAAFQGSVGGTANNREIQSHLPWDNGQVFWDCGYNRVNGGVSEDLYVNTGEWVYWVFTKNAVTGKQIVYANGQPVLNGTGSEPVDGLGVSVFYIGSKVDGSLSWPGYIDEFQVYDHVLTLEEIAIGYDPYIIAPQLEKSGSLGLSPFDVVFTGTNSVAGQGVAEYRWNFGENTNDMTAVDAVGGVVTNTFDSEGTYTITMWVVDNVGATNSLTTSVQVLAPGAPSEVISLMADTNVSSLAYYGSAVEYLITDEFNYFPSYPTEATPSLNYADGFHGNNEDGSDIWLSFPLEGSNTYTTVADYPVIIMDVWGRNYSGAENRDDDFDVVLYNGSWEDEDIVGYETGAGVDDSSKYVRVTINTMPIGTTFDRVRIIGHNPREDLGVLANAFTLTEIRLAAIEGDIVTVVAKPGADPESGYYPLDVAFEGTNSYAVEGTITDYMWNFGDGNTAGGVIASNTFTEAGVYTNTLSVVNSIGETNTTEVVVTALNPIDVVISASTNTADVGVDIVFDGSTSSNAVTNAVLTSYAWDFGDGTSAAGMMVTHSFDAGGEYTVTLTIEDDAGRSNAATTIINIQAAPMLSITNGTTLVWSTDVAVDYEVQSTEDLVSGSWATYTNVTATPPTTSVELPVGRVDAEFFQVLRD
jgi:PKD repeat protein